MQNDDKFSLYYTAGLIAVLCTVLASSCVSKRSRNPIGDGGYVPTPTPIASATPSITPILGGVTFYTDEYATEDEKKKIAQAELKAAETVKSKCFHDFLAKRDMVQTNGLTSEEVANLFPKLTGSIKVHFYYKGWPSQEVAVRYPPSTDINFNRYYWSSTTPICDYAATLVHEGYSHVLGNFDHDYKRTARRDYSVPYSAQHAIEACCPKL